MPVFDPVTDPETREACARAAAAEEKARAAKPVARPLSELRRASPGDPRELLCTRYLCRGGGLLIVGPSGIGKSSFAMQLALSFAIGREAFGIRPAGPLRLLLVQAENDEGDLAEMRDGVLAGLRFTPEEKREALARVLQCRDDEHSGADFFMATVIPLLEEHRPDILLIDPAHAYHGGDANTATDVGRFLRLQMNPVIRRFDCAVILVHHTNKPVSGREKAVWRGSDFAYLGAGSAEWANWSRAVLAIRQLQGAGNFELIAGKRGGRLGWMDSDGVSCIHRKCIRHTKIPGAICWEETPAGEQEAPEEERRVRDRPPESTDGLLKLLSPSRTYRRDTIQQLAREAGIPRDRCRELIASLLDAGSLFEHRIFRPGIRPETLYACHRQPVEQE